jgi:hypothetical protein
MKLGFFPFTAARVAAIVCTIPFGKGIAIPETLSALSPSTRSVVLGFKWRKRMHIETINVATFSARFS